MCEEVQVWCAATDVTVDTGILSSDEKLRASRFRFESDRRRWLAAHVLLRRVLGEYLGVRPAELSFVYSDYGKPALAGQKVRFNVSHSGDLAVCAIAQNSDVGIDIECIRAIDNIDSLFRSISSESEYSVLRALPPVEKTHVFFETWTLKEAFVKAKGTGLSTPVADVEALMAREGPRCVAWDGRCWPVFTFALQQKYVGAVALFTPLANFMQVKINEFVRLNSPENLA